MKRINKLLGLFITLVMFAGIVSSFYQIANATIYNVTIKVKNDQTKAREMLDMVNDFRTGEDAWYWNEDDTEKVKVENLEKLKYDYDLEKIAMQRAAEIALYWDHQRPNGTMCYTCTYNGNQTWGENIAIGYGMMYEPEEAYVSWREDNDPYKGQGHRRNMLQEFKSIGIAHAVYGDIQCWVQEFSWYDPNSAESEADNDEAYVNVEINSDYIQDAVLSSALDEINLIVGEELDLPGVNSSILITENWPGRYCNVNPQDIVWQIENTNIAKINDDKIIALQEGETNLKIDALGKEILVPIKVKGSIELNSIKNATIELDKEKYEYTGSEIIPGIKVIYNKKELVENKDYTITLENNKKIGIGTITIAGIGDYTDTISKEFEIYCLHNYRLISDQKPTCGKAGAKYYKCSICGEEYKEHVDALQHYYREVSRVESTCTEKGYILYECKNCQDEYVDMLDLSSHQYKEVERKESTCLENGYIKYKCENCEDSYKDELELENHKYEETITKATLNKDGIIENKCKVCKDGKEEIIYHPKTFKLSKTSYVYDGKEKKPQITVTDSNGKVIDSSNYKATYSANKNVGKAVVKIVFKGSYEGTKELSFTINPKGTTISKLTAGSKAFTAKWKKQKAQTTGYQIMYSTSSKFSGSKTVTVSSNKTVSKKIKSLKKKKKYYVKIRTYKTVSGKKYYSSWSGVKSVKTK